MISTERSLLADLVAIFSRMEKCQLCFGPSEAAYACHQKKLKQILRRAKKLLADAPN